MRNKVALFVLIAMVSLALVWAGLVVGSGDDADFEPADAPPIQKPKNRSPEQVWDGKVYAKVWSPNHVLISEDGELLFFMEIKVDPSIEGNWFPTISHSGIQSEMNIDAKVKLRGAAIPRATMMENRRRSHFRVNNEVYRFGETIGQVRDIVAISETFILENVSVDKEKRRFVADIHYRVAEADRDLFEVLYIDGFIVHEHNASVDFGRRIP